jgi:hypothetical protein
MSFNYKLFLHIKKEYSDVIFYIKVYWLEKINYMERYESRYKFLPEDHQLRIFYQQIESNFEIDIRSSNKDIFLTTKTNYRGNQRLIKSISSSSSDRFVKIELKPNGIFPFNGKKRANPNSPTYIIKTY